MGNKWRIEKRGNSARHDRKSIKAHAENMLKDYYPMMQRMNKIERIKGGAVMMEESLRGIIHCYCIAYSCEEVRMENIQKMCGYFGEALSALAILVAQGVLTDGEKLTLARHMEKIEEGVAKWHKSNITSRAGEGRHNYGSVVHYEPVQEPPVGT